MKIKNKICIVGLGYVGLPLSTLFSSKYEVIGYDIDKKESQIFRIILIKQRK